MDPEIEKGKLRDRALECGVPGHLIDGLLRYIVDGILPGEFLQAVLANDLMEAFGQADVESAAGMKGLCTFIYSYAPGACHGDEKMVWDWCKRQTKARMDRKVVA